MFYNTLNALSDVDIPKDTGDFRLVDRKVVDTINSLPEHNKFLRGLFSWVGYRQYAFKYERKERFAGKTKYPLKIAAHPCGAFTTGGIYTPIMIKRLPSLFSAELGANSMYNRYCNFFCIFCQGRLTDLFLILFLIVASRKDILFSNQSTNRN